MRVFLSYSLEDAPTAVLLRQSLVETGLEIAGPVINASPSESSDSGAEGPLRSSDAIVFVLTPGSARSSWVRQELEYVLGREQFEGRVFAWEPGGTTDPPWMLRRLGTLHGTPDVVARAVADQLTEGQ